jgi:hypothetical protein
MAFEPRRDMPILWLKIDTRLEEVSLIGYVLRGVCLRNAATS